MKSICFLSAMIMLSVAASAQKVSGTLKGVLQDSLSSTALADATVSVMLLKDSSLVSFTLTNKNGSFEIKNLDAGSYNFIASFTGLQTTVKKFVISAQQPVINMGVVKLDQFYKDMDEVFITEAPVRINGDTIAFKADAFKTKPNATVEDLLKKLPGMQVEKDGTVKAQGEEVKKVYVDGKEFFNNDPKLATKNLTADMVDKVELYDDMSEQAKFNGIDDGSRSKAINLKLKKDKKKGVFGKAYAGYGTKERFDMGLTANIFKGATQTSVIAKNNNTNNIGFSVSDMIGAFGMGGMGSLGGMRIVGGGGGSFGGFNLGNTGSGITKASQVGVNYRDTWSKYFDVNGSYSFNHVNTDNDQLSHRTTFNTDSTLVTDDHAFSRAENDNHRLNMRLVYSLDSFNSIIYTPTVSYQKSYNTYSVDTFATDVFKNDIGYRSNESRNAKQSDGDGSNFSNNLIWRRKFRRPGRTFSLNLSNTTSSSERNAYSMLNAKFYNSNGEKSLDSSSNTLSKSLSENNSYAANLSYTEPLGRDKTLEVNYSHNNNASNSDQRSYDYNEGSKEYDVVNKRLTNNFETQNVYDRLGANLRIVKKKYNYQLGVTMQRATLQNDNITKNSSIEHTFTNLLPTASFTYNFARSRSFRINYRGTPRMPGVSQMQDVEDIQNYPFITRGNPSLKQEFTHNINLSYNFFDIIKFRNLFASINISNTQNKIANFIQQLDGGLAQLSTPVNMDGGVYNVNANFNIGFPIKKLKGGNFNTNTRFSYNTDANYVNAVKNNTNSLTAGEDLRLSYSWKEKLDLGVSAGITYYKVRYSAQPRGNTQYFTHSYSLDGSYSFPAGLVLSSDFDYTFNTGRTDGFNRNYAMWNASLAKDVFKNKKGEVKISVFDILDQNASVTRETGPNYVRDVQSSVLNRFFMLTFTYRLNRMGGKAMPRVMERATRDIRVTL